MDTRLTNVIIVIVNTFIEFLDQMNLNSINMILRKSQNLNPIIKIKIRSIIRRIREIKIKIKRIIKIIIMIRPMVITILITLIIETII